MDILAIDTETTLIVRQGTEKINTKHRMPQIVCASYSCRHGDGVVATDDELFQIIASKKWDAIVFHNGSFDMNVLKQWPRSYKVLREYLRNREMLDTLTMYYLRDPDPPIRKATLDELSFRFRGKRLGGKDDTRLTYLPGKPLTEKQRAYAIEDAVATKEVALALLDIPYGAYRSRYRSYQSGAIHAPKTVLLVADTETNICEPDFLYSAAACWLHEGLGTRGFTVDQENLKTEHFKLKMEVAKLGEKLSDCGYAEFVRVPKQQVRVIGRAHPDIDMPSRWTYCAYDGVMKRRWKGQEEHVDARLKLCQAPIEEDLLAFAEKNRIRYKTSPKTNKISKKRDDWKDYYNRMPANLQTFLDYERAKKYLTAFTEPLIAARAKRVHPQYFVPGAATLRWACRKPNIQQVPHKLRHLYRAAEGNILLYADFPTLELYALAHTMHCMGIEGPLMEALHAGDDIHTLTAALMYGKDPKQVTLDERQAAKLANFGLPGGMRENRFLDSAKARGVKWNYADAKRVRELWLDGFPDIAEYLEQLTVNVKDTFKPPSLTDVQWFHELGIDVDRDGWPSNFELSRTVNDGRVYSVKTACGLTVHDRNYNQAANIPFQLLGGVVITEASVQCAEQGVPLIAVVHDSLTCEEKASASALSSLPSKIKTIMSDSLRKVCPTAPDIRSKIDVKIQELWT